MAVRSLEEHLARSRRRVAAAKLLFREGHIDDGANRLYYALYEAACAALKAKSRRVPGKHIQILRLFDEVYQDQGPQWEVAIGTFQDVAGDRIDADYELFDASSYDANARVQ